MIKKNAKKIEQKEAWFRIVVAIISGIILGVWKGLIQILELIHWVIVIFTGKRNKKIAMFSEYWNTEIYKFLRYMAFVSNKRPFPFSRLQRISKFS